MIYHTHLQNINGSVSKTCMSLKVQFRTVKTVAGRANFRMAKDVHITVMISLMVTWIKQQVG